MCTLESFTRNTCNIWIISLRCSLHFCVQSEQIKNIGFAVSWCKAQGRRLVTLEQTAWATATNAQCWQKNIGYIRIFERIILDLQSDDASKAGGIGHVGTNYKPLERPRPMPPASSPPQRWCTGVKIVKCLPILMENSFRFKRAQLWLVRAENTNFL